MVLYVAIALLAGMLSTLPIILRFRRELVVAKGRFIELRRLAYVERESGRALQAIMFASRDTETCQQAHHAINKIWGPTVKSVRS